MSTRQSKNIILGVTASIAMYKSCEIIRQLLQVNLCVGVVMTKNATRLISPQVFSSLVGDGDNFSHTLRPRQTVPCHKRSPGVFYNEFVSSTNRQIEHISLAKWADLVLVAPATANIIGKIASGIADDLLTTLIMAVRVPVLIAPAMNENMYKNKIVKANIEKLKKLGYKFIGPKTGRLACGDVGVGHLAEVETIIKVVKKQLSFQPESCIRNG